MGCREAVAVLPMPRARGCPCVGAVSGFILRRRRMMGSSRSSEDTFYLLFDPPTFDRFVLYGVSFYHPRPRGSKPALMARRRSRSAILPYNYNQHITFFYFHGAYLMVVSLLISRDHGPLNLNINRDVNGNMTISTNKPNCVLLILISHVASCIIDSRS